MRHSALLAMSAILASLVMPAAQAADLQYGLAPTALPDLGPAGNGRRLFVELNCYLCHGAHAGGEVAISIAGAEAGDVQEAVTQGIPEAGMPSFGKYVSATDIKNIAAYLASVGTASEPKWFDWWVPHPKQ